MHAVSTPSSDRETDTRELELVPLYGPSEIIRYQRSVQFWKVNGDGGSLQDSCAHVVVVLVQRIADKVELRRSGTFHSPSAAEEKPDHQVQD